MPEYNFKGKDVISISDFSKGELECVLDKAQQMEEMPEKEKFEILRGSIIATLFFEPSTRTRLSFESAMNRLGGRVINVTDAKASGAAKGETIYDTMKMVESYADIIVMRHNLDGAARRAADATEKPVINAGDGKNQHPTQTMLDMYSIKKTQGTLDELTIAMVGDLRYGRTVHSLAQAMSKYKTKFRFVAPSFLQMPDDLLKELSMPSIEAEFTLHKDINEVIKDVDILYMTRMQKERFADPSEYEKAKDLYVLTEDMLKDVRNNMKILHPLPRVTEIPSEIDRRKEAYYFQQAKNGVYVREALLAMILGAK